MCVLCINKEEKYSYKLNSGRGVNICEECGEILYGQRIGEMEKTEFGQLLMMAAYVRFVQSKQVKKIVKIKAS